MKKKYQIHKSAIIGRNVQIGKSVKIWSNALIRDNVKIGANSSIGIGVYVGENVVIGSNCKIQNYSQLYEGSILEDGVFIGPMVVLTNDKYPRALNSDGFSKSTTDWNLESVYVKAGASIGAGSICVAPVTIGENSMIGAGSVVVKNVKSATLVGGVPAKMLGQVCKHGYSIYKNSTNPKTCNLCV